MDPAFPLAQGMKDNHHPELGNYAAKVHQTDKAYQIEQGRARSHLINKQWTSSPHHSQNSTPDLGQLSNKQEIQLPLLQTQLPELSPHHCKLLDSTDTNCSSGPVIQDGLTKSTITNYSN